MNNLQILKSHKPPRKKVFFFFKSHEFSMASRAFLTEILNVFILCAFSFRTTLKNFSPLNFFLLNFFPCIKNFLRYKIGSSYRTSFSSYNILINIITIIMFFVRNFWNVIILSKQIKKKLQRKNDIQQLIPLFFFHFFPFFNVELGIKSSNKCDKKIISCGCVVCSCAGL